MFEFLILCGVVRFGVRSFSVVLCCGVLVNENAGLCDVVLCGVVLCCVVLWSVVWCNVVWV